MKPLAAHNQDKLLDYAYGELPGPEAKSLEAHLQSCPECTQALGSIQKVRRTMSQLPPASAPSAGLESLIDYARQSARRAQSKAPTRWSRLWLPGAAASVAALSLVVVFSSRVHKVADLSRAALTTPTEQEPRTQDLAFRAAPAAPSRTDTPTSEGLKGNDEMVALAEAKKRASGPAPHRRAPSKEMDERESKDQEASQGIVGGAVGGIIPGLASESAARAGKPERRSASGLALQSAKGKAPIDDLGNENPKASTAGEVYGRAREESAPLPASQAARAMPQVAPASGVAPDRPNEIERIRRALSSQDLSGTQRAALLGRLCALLYEAGQRSEADSTCDAVIRDFPTTDFAASARRLKAQYAPPRPNPEK